MVGVLVTALLPMPGTACMGEMSLPPDTTKAYKAHQVARQIVTALLITNPSIRPLPITNLGHVVPMYTNVLLVFEPLVAHQLFHLRANLIKPGHAINDVHHQMKTVEII